MDPRLIQLVVGLYWYVMKMYIYISRLLYRWFLKYYFIIEYLKLFLPVTPNKDIYIIDNSIIKHNETFNNILTMDLGTYECVIYKQQTEELSSLFFSNNMEQIIKLHSIGNTLKLCKFQFILVLIKCGEITHDITKYTKQYNYYVVGSQLFDKNFINWININHLQIELIDPIISFMDNNINEITLDKTQHVKLNEDNYEIISIE
jgi:hypothetical protein